MHRYETSTERLYGAVGVALELIGLDGVVEVLAEHCPAGVRPSVLDVEDRTACMAALLDAVRWPARRS